jgi:3-hydroxybutyryl-CoA dehydrogenase
VLEQLDVSVVGAGLMGHGIAQVFATAGARVSIFDPAPDVLASVPARIAANLELLGEDGAVAGDVRLVGDLAQAVAGAAWVFEAGPERLPLKQELFAEIEAAVGADCIIATNTSVLRVSEIAALLRKPERALGTHWWNPPYLVPLVEVVEGERTAPGTVKAAMSLLEALGKTAVHVRRDVPGFVGNRLQHALWRQAFELVDAGVCDAETVDTVVKASFGRRLAVLGPMENADLVGLDLTLDIHEYVLPALDPPSQPSSGLRSRVAAGELGAKTGSGFRVWAPGDLDALRRRVFSHLVEALRGEASR